MTHVVKIIFTLLIVKLLMVLNLSDIKVARNRLPNDIKIMTSLNSFKNNLILSLLNSYN